MTNTSPGSVQRKIADGARRMVTLRFGERLLRLVSFSVTARILLPSDFGLLALASSIIAFFELFGQAGMDLALIQRKDLGREEYDTAWTIRLLIALGVAAIVSVSAVPLAGVMHEPRLVGVLYFLAAGGVIEGFSNIATVDFRKFLDFRLEFWLRLLTRLVMIAVTITFALLWRNYWALVVGSLVGSVSLVVLSYVMRPYRPRFSLGALGTFASFSGWMLVRNILNGLNDQLINLVVARQISVGALAFFTAGREIAGLATTEIQAPIRATLFPGYAALSHDPEALRRNYLDWTAVIVLLTLPIPAGLVMVAPDLVRVLMGERWLPTAHLIEILALAGVLRSFASGAQFLFIAVGQPRISAKLAALRSFLLFPLVILGAHLGGATGVAWAMVGAAAIMFAVNLPFVTRTLTISRFDMFAATHRPVIATLAMMIILWGASTAVIPPQETIGALGHLLATTMLGAALYAGGLFTLWVLAGRPPGAEHRILGVLSQGLMRPQVSRL